jgi:RNA polymerase sigma-70 factor (ECF subfamily)
MDPIAESTPSTPSTLLARPALNAEEASEVVQRVRRAQAGDLAAYDQLVHQFQERIYGLCYHMTSHHEDAHDLAQDTFVKAWQALKNFKGDSSFYTWIYRIAVNTCLNHLKLRRNRTQHLSLNDLDLQPENHPVLVALVSDKTPRREANLAELQRRLNEAILKLSEDHRTVVTLHDIQGLPHDQIAKILGVNPGTIRSRLFYAHQQLQGSLADWVK